MNSFTSVFCSKNLTAYKIASWNSKTYLQANLLGLNQHYWPILVLYLQISQKKEKWNLTDDIKNKLNVDTAKIDTENEQKLIEKKKRFMLLSTLFQRTPAV